MGTTDLKSIIKLLNEYRVIMIGTHERPDGDAVGSVLALANLLRQDPEKRIMACVDAVPVSMAFLPGADSLIEWSRVSEDTRPDIFVAVDCGTSTRLGKGYPFFIQASVRINIDHHISNDFYGDFNLVDPHASATGEILYRIIQEMDRPLDVSISTCLYAAIATDTGSFRYANTTSDTHRIAAELLQSGLNAFETNQLLFDTRSAEELHLLASVLSTFELALSGQVALLSIRQSMLDDHDIMDAEAENYAGFARSVRGVRVAVLLREQEELVRVSFRSRDDTDVNAIAQLFGGGGHRKASGAVIRGNLESVRQRVLDRIEAYLAGSESHEV